MTSPFHSVGICVIYGGTGTPTFWTEGYRTPHIPGRKGEEFAVTCCQQRRSADIKLQRSPRPRVWGGQGYLLQFSSPNLGTKGRLVLLLIWYPHFLDQSYAPVSWWVSLPVYAAASSSDFNVSVKLDYNWRYLSIEMGWDAIIIHPKHFFTGYCYGSCPMSDDIDEQHANNVLYKVDHRFSYYTRAYKYLLHSLLGLYRRFVTF